MEAEKSSQRASMHRSREYGLQSYRTYRPREDMAETAPKEQPDNAAIASMNGLEFVSGWRTAAFRRGQAPT